MKKLTSAEEQIMQILWKLKKAFVKEIIAEMPGPPPAYNTVSTLVRILETKGFVDHKAFGKTHQYFPVVSKEEYSNMYLNNFISNYFSGSFEKMVSFFVKQNDVKMDDVEELMKLIEQQKKDDDQKG